ncbi:hypothetical protein BAE44_0013652, partial [Dichanthelium oligosanthes]
LKGGYTNKIWLLLKAGADPNIPDDICFRCSSNSTVQLPVEIAALNDCMEGYELLFPLTSIPGVPNWSVDGVISHAKLESAKPLEERHIVKRKATFKSLASNAFKQKDYGRTASKLYMVWMMRPDDWVKACYCQVAAHMLLGENNQACIARSPLDAQKLDHRNEVIEQKLR